MEISSTIFEDNYALNGGALYISGPLNDNNNKQIDIEIFNSQFLSNKALYYGGAIYLNSNNYDLSKIKNLNFMKNSAYAGGSIFFNSNNFTLFEMKKNEVKFINNTSESHGNNIATKPYMVHLITSISEEISIKSGIIYPLLFELDDQFDQIIVDESKYYSNINIHIININNDIDDDIMIKGNSCIFHKGNIEKII